MKIIFIIIFSLTVLKSHAQTYDEWFRQKKTQKKYLVDQIAALQTYIGYAEKGYRIAESGLKTIHSIKNGDFNLHSNYINSLFSVNPRVKNYIKVAGIISMQISIAKQVRGTIKQCTNKKKLTAVELDYMQQVFNNVLDDCAKNLDELFSLITDGSVQMKDDERINSIDKLYDEVQDSRAFVQSFSRSAKGLSLQRESDSLDIQIEKKLNGLQ